MRQVKTNINFLEETIVNKKYNNKTNCFALKKGACAVTTNKHCPDYCPFYKTKKEFKSDFLNAKELLTKNGGLKQAKETYALFDKMCSSIQEDRQHEC